MERTNFARIVAFTDGVIAVAITLLVLNFDVPTVDEGDLRDALIDLLPSLYVYVLAFALIGRFWVIHHDLFDTLERFDGRLMFLNLLFLLLLALIPFATNLLGEYPESALATATFSISIALVSLCHWSMTARSITKDFVHEEHREAYGRRRAISSLGIAVTFLIAGPLAFISIWIAHVLWISTFVLRYPLRRLAT